MLRPGAGHDPARELRGDEPAVYALEGSDCHSAVPSTGCDKLHFNPQLEFKPSPPSEGGTSQADEPTGMTMNLKVPQTNEAGKPATPELKNLKMTLPAGMTVSPVRGGRAAGVQQRPVRPGTESGCEAGCEHRRTGRAPARCPLASQIGTVEVFTPLLSGAPTIQGVPRAGEELTCSQGMWSGSPTLSYQWLRNGVAIETRWRPAAHTRCPPKNRSPRKTKARRSSAR